MYFVHIIENLENVTHSSSPILPMKHFITKINALQYVSHLYHTNTFHFCVYATTAQSFIESNKHTHETCLYTEILLIYTKHS